VTAAAASLALIPGGQAWAGVTAATAGSVVFITSDGGSDSITVACSGGTTFVNAAQALPALACTGVTFVTVDDSGGNDSINLGGFTAGAFPALATVNVDTTDAGTDTVVGSDLRDLVAADQLDTVFGGAGNDRIADAKAADGGDGNDLLLEPADTATGGPGSDRIVSPVNGPLDGGPGDDTVELGYDDLTDQPLVITVSDSGYTFNTGLPATLSAVGIEQWVLSMPDNTEAPQTIDSHVYSGSVTARMHSGPDTFLGGPGGDVVESGAGADTVSPAGGGDTVRAGDGNDTVSVRDGAVDIVDCGLGADTVTADRSDVLTGCEGVSLPAPETDKIAGPKKVTKGEKATFTFGSSVAGATFECQVDKGSFKACASPFKLKTKKLKTGKHTLKVRAVAGGADPSPSTFTFKVVAPKP